MKSSLVLVALLALTCSVIAKPSVLDGLYYGLNGFDEVEHKFGAAHYKKSTAEGSESHVYWPQNGFLSEPEHFKQVYDTIIKAQEQPELYDPNSAHLEACDRGDLPDYWKFFGEYVGLLNASNTQVSYKSPCFDDNTFEIVFVDATTVEVVHKTKRHHGIICGDGYFMASTLNYHVELVYTSGTHKTVFKDLSAYEYQLIQESGIFVFRYCDSVINVIPDIFMTLMLFLGGMGKNPNNPIWGSKPNVLQEEMNVQFIKQATGYQWEARPHTEYVELDTSLIKSGDFFAVIRFNGNDVAIEYGSGSHVGHSTMALWMDGELYIVESQGGKGWPKEGLQRNLYADWMQYAQNAGYQVTWLPLKPEYAAVFNETSAIEWFETVEGMPYGYEAFLWGWVDTANESFPVLLSPQYLPAFFNFIGRIAPSAPAQMFAPGINKRLGTENLTIPELAMYIAENGLNWADIYAIVEEEGWIYGDHYSYTCSGFVTAMWKAGGLFDGYTINSPEWTPRDIYQSTFIDPAPPVPENCKSVDPVNPYCQVMGKYRIQFPGISSVEIYNNMNDHCPSVPPLYERTPGC